MINKKIALSALTIVISLSLMAGATYAFFTDQATSTGNTFSTGNADLQIAVDNEGNPGTYGNDIPTPAITQNGMGPNFSQTYYFWLKNNSTSNINLGLAANFASVAITGNAGIVDQLNASIDCGGGPTASLTINQWAGGPQNLSAALAPNAQVRCSMTVGLPNVDNTFQNSTVSFNGVFTGTQQ